MALPTGKQENKATEAFEPGNYEVRLKALNLSTETEFESSNHNNGAGLHYQAIELIYDIDGESLHEKFVRVSTNPRAKFYNRICAFFGRELTEDDTIEWGVSEEAETNHPLDQYYKANADDKEKGIKKGEWVLTDEKPKYEGILGAVNSLKINGEELIGKSCLLNVIVNDKGYNRMSAGAAAPLPKRANARRAQPTPQNNDDATTGMPT